MRIMLLSVGLLFIASQGLATVLRSQVQSLIGKKLNGSVATTIDLSLSKVYDEKGRNALHYAVILGNLALVEFFLANDTDTKAKDREGLIPLHYAERIVAYQPSIEQMQIMSLVLEKTLGVNSGDARGWPPIVWSLMAGDYPRVLELCDRGADIFAGPRQQGERLGPSQSAVWAAEYLQDNRAIKILTEDMLKKYSGGWMHPQEERLIDLFASSQQDDRVFKDIAKLVPDWYYFDAINKGYLKLQQAMLDRGFNPATAKDKHGVSLIMKAAKSGQVAKVQELIDNGAQLDSKVLFLAISSANAELVEAILEDNNELAGKLLIDLMYDRLYIPQTVKSTIGHVLIGTNPDDNKQRIYKVLTKAINESTAPLPSLATIAKLLLLKEVARGDGYVGFQKQPNYIDTSLFSIALAHDLKRELREILTYANATTRMRWGVYLGDIELFKQALAEDADVNDRAGFRIPIIYEIVWKIVNLPQKQHYREMLTLLLAHGANPNVTTKRFKQDYPINDLIRAEDSEGVKIMLDYGAKKAS